MCRPVTLTLADLATALHPRRCAICQRPLAPVDADRTELAHFSCAMRELYGDEWDDFLANAPVPETVGEPVEEVAF